ncbi:MAG: AAA-like domain-containing protein [Armatimonas sp.]
MRDEAEEYLAKDDQDCQGVVGAEEGPLTISLLGTFRLERAGKELPSLHSRRCEELLAYLALRGGAAVSRQALAAIFWPNSHPTRALYNLRRTLSDLRQALGSEERRLECPDSRSLRINLNDAEVDALLFDRAIRRGDTQSLIQAISLYQGTLLPSCAEIWITPERVAREQDYLVALERLTEDARARQQGSQATAYLRRILAVEPERESAVRSLLEILHTTGDNATALAFYRDYRLRLHDTLGLQPSPEIRALQERIKAQVVRDGDVSTRLTAPTSQENIGAVHDIEPAGGAVPLTSCCYIERGTDSRFFEALSRGDSIVLVKGPRQVGKTSLLARGLQRARNSGFRVVVTDLQKFSPSQLQSADNILLAFARQMAAMLDLDITPESAWSSERPPNENFERFLRRYVLGENLPPLVWALDEVDHLFPCSFGGEIFGLFRSWHNERALDPDGPWGKLTLAMAYATEAYLFITDLNQSPFNVGTRLTLEDFTESEVATLNQKYGQVLTNVERPRFIQLVGGHPYLVRRGLQELATGKRSLTDLEETAPRDNGPYSDHLRRLLFSLRQDMELVSAIQDLLRGGPLPTLGAFYRLQSAGLLRGESPEAARIRCGLYVRYLERHL